MISNIRLQNFRSYGDASFEFEDGVNIVVGPNASGKTNLLEAILVLASGASFRARNGELIRFGKEWARLDGQFEKHRRTLKLVLQGQSLQQGLSLQKAVMVEKTFELDDKLLKRLNLERTIPVVLFEPNHLQLIIRGPEQRRLFFDDILERTTPSFKTLSSKYHRTLAQRNALLKHDPAKAKSQLFAWNIRLSELAAQIVAARLELISEINRSISRTYSIIAGKRSKVVLVYDSSLLQGRALLQGSALQASSYSSRLLSKLEASTRKDFERGFTGHGPHREDVIIRLDGQVAAAGASRGEMRSLLLALKIFELGLVSKARGSRPIFLLDDVFSELDGARRRHLVEHLKGHQTIITTTDADAALEYFSDQHNLIPLVR